MRIQDIIARVLGARKSGVYRIKRKAHNLTTCSIVWTALSMLAIAIYFDKDVFGRITAYAVWCIHILMLIGSILCWIFEKKKETTFYDATSIESD